MAYSEAPAQRTRPGLVTVAMYLMYGLAALQIIGIVLAFVQFGPSMDGAKDYLDSVPTASQEDKDATLMFLRLGIYLTAAFGILFAAAWGVLAVLDGKGKQPARIVTWVLGGLFLLCMVCGLAGNAVGSSMGGTSDNGIDQQKLQDAAADAVPGWITPVSIVITVLQFLLVLGVIILLALPAAHPFFRKPEPQWQPPVDAFPGTPPTFPPSGAAGDPPFPPGPSGPTGSTGSGGTPTG